MSKRRVLFIFVWTALSIIGILMPDLHSTYLGFFLLGFHTPRDSVFFLKLYALFSPYPKLAILSIIFFVIFISLWIFALVRIKRSFLFENLIVADAIFSLVRMSATTLILKENFEGYVYIFGLIAVSVLSIFLSAYFRCNSSGTKTPN